MLFVDGQFDFSSAPNIGTRVVNVSRALTIVRLDSEPLSVVGPSARVRSLKVATLGCVKTAIMDCNRSMLPKGQLPLQLIGPRPK